MSSSIFSLPQPLMCFAIIAASICIQIACEVPVYSQHITNGLGDATVIQSATSTDPYGTASVNSALAGEVMSTRHRRAFQSSGIGGSFMGTTSVTAETRPIGEATIVQPTHLPALVAPGAQLQTGRGLFSQSMLSSPALSSSANFPAFSAIPEPNIAEFKNESTRAQLDMRSLMMNMNNRYNRMLNTYGGGPEGGEQPYKPFGY